MLISKSGGDRRVGYRAARVLHSCATNVAQLVSDFVFSDSSRGKEGERNVFEGPGLQCTCWMRGMFGEGGVA